MNAILPILVLAPAIATAQIHKCTIDGRLVYQQEPCGIRGGTGERIRVTPPSTSAYDLTAADTAPEPNFQIVNTTQQEAHELFKKFRDPMVYSLKDPGSAIFDSVSVLRVRHVNELGIYLCGFVNAKNSYGGYVGKDLFFSDGSRMALKSENFPRVKKIGGLLYSIRRLPELCIKEGTRVQ